ncbi:hypothetical protein OK016_29510 [Vibrio chagasii]|nr:hypothetical protein [Vibrio chagasii]
MLFQFFIGDYCFEGAGGCIQGVPTLGRFPSFTPDEKERIEAQYRGYHSIVVSLGNWCV